MGQRGFAEAAALIVIILTGLMLFMLINYLNNFPQLLPFNSIINRVVDTNKPLYYARLAKDCPDKEDWLCCLNSVRIMVSGDYREATGSCLPGMRENSPGCSGGYNWCEPVSTSSAKIP